MQALRATWISLSSTSSPHDFQRCRCRRTSGCVPRAPRLLRPGVRPPGALVRQCSRAECPHGFPREPPKLSPLSDELRQVPNFVVGDCAWVLDTATAIRQGAIDGTDAKVLEAFESFCFQLYGLIHNTCGRLFPPGDTPDGSPSRR